MSGIYTGGPVSGLGMNAQREAPKKTLGKDDFLALLVSQLNNQDPLNPMEGTEFSAQLAQFSSLEQLSNINESLQQSLDANYILTSSINNTLAANVIGKDVKAYGNQLYLGPAKTATINFNLSQDASDVQIEILDSNDQVRRTISLSDLEHGDNSYTWDGKDSNGIMLPSGSYSFRVTAKDANGESVSAETYIQGKISAVRYGATGATLVVGGIEVQMSDVYEILNG